LHGANVGGKNKKDGEAKKKQKNRIDGKVIMLALSLHKSPKVPKSPERVLNNPDYLRSTLQITKVI
jgi:hypothetical protein